MKKYNKNLDLHHTAESANERNLRDILREINYIIR